MLPRYRKNDSTGPRNTRKDAKNFRSKTDGISFITFLVDFLFVYFVCFVG
jgi:hypothetical protein